MSVRNIIDGEFCFREDDSRVSEAHFREISQKFLISDGDIQLAIVGAALGKVAIVKSLAEPIVTQRSLATIRTNEQISTEFLVYYLEAPLYQSFLWQNAGYSAQPGIYLGTIQASFVSLPPLGEQEQIVNHLNDQSSKIQEAIGLKERQVEALKEYKATLIDATVTGKIKVI